MERESKANQPRNQVLFKRVVAFCIDYCIIIAYAALLFSLVYFVFEPAPMGPIKGQFVAFFSLTLPVFIYSFILERSKWRATVGKRIMRLQVIGEGSALLRNFLKYLPWEVAHGGVHWAFAFSEQGRPLPFYLWLLLILPQIIVVIYFASVVISKGKASIYDRISGFSVMMS